MHLPRSATEIPAHVCVSTSDNERDGEREGALGVTRSER